MTATVSLTRTSELLAVTPSFAFPSGSGSGLRLLQSAARGVNTMLLTAAAALLAHGSPASRNSCAGATVVSLADLSSCNGTACTFGDTHVEFSAGPVLVRDAALLFGSAPEAVAGRWATESATVPIGVVDLWPYNLLYANDVRHGDVPFGDVLAAQSLEDLGFKPKHSFSELSAFDAYPTGPAAHFIGSDVAVHDALDESPMSPMLLQPKREAWGLGIDWFGVTSVGVSADSSIPLHFHGSTWLYLLRGTKEWFMAAPGDEPPPELGFAFPTAWPPLDAASRNSTGRVRRCVQTAGELLYLPGGWHHATRSSPHLGFGMQAGSVSPNKDQLAREEKQQYVHKRHHNLTCFRAGSDRSLVVCSNLYNRLVVAAAHLSNHKTKRASRVVLKGVKLVGDAVENRVVAKEAGCITLSRLLSAVFSMQSRKRAPASQFSIESHHFFRGNSPEALHF